MLIAICDKCKRECGSRHKGSRRYTQVSYATPDDVLGVEIMLLHNGGVDENTDLCEDCFLTILLSVASDKLIEVQTQENQELRAKEISLTNKLFHLDNDLNIVRKQRDTVITEYETITKQFEDEKVMSKFLQDQNKKIKAEVETLKSELTIFLENKTEVMKGKP